MSAEQAGVRVTAMSTAMATQIAPTVPMTPEERDAGDVEREQGDEHGRPGEDDGVAGRAVREADGLVQARRPRFSCRRCRLTMNSE